VEEEEAVDGWARLVDEDADIDETDTWDLEASQVTVHLVESVAL